MPFNDLSIENETVYANFAGIEILHKNNKMQKKHLILYLYLPLIGCLTACNDENSQVGQSLVETGFRNIIVDSCEVGISTIYMDSLVTRGDSLCQLGYHSDSIWGKVCATYYAEFNVSSFAPAEEHSYAFDSLTLHLTHSGHYWGDTLQAQHIGIYRLREPIDLSDDRELYNRTSLPLEENPSFTFTFNPRPGAYKEQIIRLPDEWGQSLLQDLVTEKEYFDSQEKFRAKFPGIALMPQTDGTCISGFLVNDSSYCIKLHYHEVSNIRDENILSFTVNKEHAFTGVYHDRTGSPLSVLQYGIENAVHYNQLENKAYLQGLTGVYNQIEFPTLSYLEAEGDIVSVESATLYLYPLSGSYGSANQLPQELRLYITDDNNVLEDYVYGSDGVTIQTGNIVVDEQFGKETYYSFDLTDFCRNNLGAWGIQRQRLLLSLEDTDMTTTFNQVVFTNNRSLERQCRLTLRIKIYNKK